MAVKQLNLMLVTSLNDLKKYEKPYKELIDKMDGEILNLYSLDYLEALSPIYLQDRTLFFLLLWDQNKLAAVAPLALVKRGWKKLWYHQLQMLGAIEHSLAISCPSFLIDPDYDTQHVMSKFMKHIMSSSLTHWDKLYISGMAEGKVLRSIQNLTQQELIPRPHIYKIDCQHGFDNYFENQFDKNLKKRLNRLGRKIENEFPNVEYQCSEIITEKLFQEMADVHSGRQKVKRDNGRSIFRSIFDTDCDRQCYYQLLVSAEKQSRLRIYQIRNNGELICFRQSIRVGHCEIFQLAAFDDAFKKYSPSKLLGIWVTKRLAEEGVVNCLDFHPNITGFKKEFCNLVSKRYDMVILNENSLLSRVRNTISEFARRQKEPLSVQK